MKISPQSASNQDKTALIFIKSNYHYTGRTQRIMKEKSYVTNK